MATILVVDDDIPILELLSELLEEWGHTTLRAINGQQALELARQHRPDIIITDIMMPVMDGYELLHSIRSIPELARTSVILASAGVSKLRAITDSLLADGYMQKPFNLAEVEQLIHGAIMA